MLDFIPPVPKPMIIMEAIRPPRVASELPVIAGGIDVSVRMINPIKYIPDDKAIVLNLPSLVSDTQPISNGVR